MLSDEEVFTWCASRLSSSVAEVVFATGNLSRVIGVVLSDGRMLVVKVRPRENRLLACAVVQRHLVDGGYLCPALLAGPDQHDGRAISAEAAVSGGDQLDPQHGAAPIARLLHRLVAVAPPVHRVPSLLPSPPVDGLGSPRRGNVACSRWHPPGPQPRAWSGLGGSRRRAGAAESRLLRSAAACRAW